MRIIGITFRIWQALQRFWFGGDRDAVVKCAQLSLAVAQINFHPAFNAFHRFAMVGLLTSSHDEAHSGLLAALSVTTVLAALQAQDLKEYQVGHQADGSVVVPSNYV